MLTRRVRVLLHALPLLETKLHEGRLDEEFQHYDRLALAVKAMDVIIEHMGLEREVDSALLGRELKPLLEAMDEAGDLLPDDERHRAMVEKVLGALRNDAEGRRPFRYFYHDYDEEQGSHERQLEFRLAEERFGAGEGTVLQLSDEAVNLYLNALELDIEDAQAAAEAVVQEQLDRGRISEAVQSARDAQMHSRRYEEKIELILRETRRDLSRVDWREEVPELLETALSHLERRLDIEGRIQDSAEDRLDELPGEDEEAKQVAGIRDQIRECRQRHLKVQRKVMQARGVFLDEQARQVFSNRPPGYMPELRSEVLEPLLRMGTELAHEVLDESIGALAGVEPPPLLSLRDQVLWQLQPKRQVNAEAVPVKEPDLVESGGEWRRYGDEALAEAEAVVGRLEGSMHLSDLLERDFSSENTRELVALRALRDYQEDPHPEPGRLSVERLAGVELRIDGFYGHDLLLSPPQEENDAD